MNECVPGATAQVSLLLWWLAENKTINCLLLIRSEEEEEVLL